MKTSGIKTFFFVIIFLFSTALAYFSANWIVSVSHMNYHVVLLLFGAVYAIIGIAIVSILPVSLGFLFPADILILHTLIEEYGGIEEVYKTIIIGVLLVAAYSFAWIRLRDQELIDVPLNQTPPPPPVAPHIH